ncbi:MAG: ABC transporter substrate-binding protein [Treponema sp.]|jgi:simple sugar transport system substrate-binding protein|nr:ABC transporter substrate-binding protein [Treponema sp.]
MAAKFLNGVRGACGTSRYSTRFEAPFLRAAPRKLLALIFSLLLSSCPKAEKTPASRDALILGFSQIGAESAWRIRNTQSVQESAKQAGIQLLFANAEQKQENQIKAIRSFIAYQVDVIAFVPIVVSGWDNVLQEARKAGIPVLVTDRKIDADESLYAGFIGTDSEKEGREAALFLLDKFAGRRKAGDLIRVAEFSGTVGSSVADGRAKGFRDIIEKEPEFEIFYSKSGDFMRSKGYELMRTLLENRPQIDVLFSHNDSMTLGAMDAMREAGLRPGEDIAIITIDAQQKAIDALKAGEVNCVIECNPNQGPLIMDIAKQLIAGGQTPRFIHVDEAVFREGDDLSVLPPRGY